MNHLNEDKLIQYAFDLMDEGGKNAAQRHLDECGDCAEALKILQAKFAMMDTLNADEAPADDLIARTLKSTTQHTVTPSGGLRRSAFALTAAAAVAIVCILLLDDLPNPQVREPGISKDRTLIAKLDTPGNPPDLTAPPPSKGVELLKSSPPAKGEYPEGGRGFDVRVVSADEIPDAPPFAPASAIELVVLPKPDKTQVTIYNSADLTLVRDTRKLTLKPGWNWIQFMWANTQIDPTSLSLTPLEHAEKVDIQLISYPARLKDIGRWLIRSEVEGAVPFEITYFASGLNWRAFYMGTMNEDETIMDLKGYVNVANNSGQDFKNTQTRLIVGETRLTEEIRYLARRHYPYGPDVFITADEKEGIDHALRDNWRGKKKVPLRGDMSMVGEMFREDSDMAGGASLGYEIKKIEKTGLSEYFLYTIEGTENLTNQWTKRLPSFDVADIPVKSLYKYDDDRYGKQAVRFVSFANDIEHELGDTPIPEGAIKIYRNVNEQKNLSYIGGSNIKYIPVNEDIELNLGPARLVKVEPVLMETKTENHTFGNKGNINGWDEIESYKVTITNARDIPIDIEITWNMGTDAWELTYIDFTSNPEDSITYKKHDKSRARFTMTIPARLEKVFSHTIRKYRKNRIEAYVEKKQEKK